MNRGIEGIKQETNSRRSQRVLIRVPVVVRGKSTDDSPWQEKSLTSAVNVHGGLIALATRVARGQTLVLRNVATGEEQECQAIFLGAMHDSKSEVGIEFKRPAPNFWRINFPPVDWKPILD
jgi:hypothetical protein